MSIPSGLGNALTAHALHDTAKVPSRSVGLWLTVTGAGTVNVEDVDGTVTAVEFATGSHYFPLANIVRVKTGGDATLDPATTVFVLHSVAEP
jgi:hypothetical protein